MPTLQDTEVWIEMDGVRLSEFKTEMSQTDGIFTSSCWIPCDAGKQFKIACRLPPRSDVFPNDCKLTFRVDGQKACLRRSIWRARDRDGSPRYFIEERVGDGGTIRTLQFGSLQLTDEDAYLDSANPQLGEIKVSVYTVDKIINTKDTPTYSTSQPKETRVHERSKKGLAHCVKFSKETPCEVNANYIEAIGKKKVYQFLYYYRHMDILIARSIAPSTQAGTARLRLQTGASRTRRIKDETGDSSIKSEGADYSIKYEDMDNPTKQEETGGSFKYEDVDDKVKDEEANDAVGSASALKDVWGARTQASALKRTTNPPSQSHTSKRIKREHLKQAILSQEIIDLTI